MNYYPIHANSRQQLRQQLRQLKLYSIKYSSCYQLEQKLYLLLSCEQNIPNLSIYLPTTEIFAKLNTPLALLSHWAYSELQQDINWLKLEDNAQIGLNCVYLIQQQTKITRSFLPLTESMLIINQTPDSFSDGGKLFQQTEKTLMHIEEALNSGVNIIDIGAESTRPGASYLTPQEEIHRLHDIIQAIHELKTSYQFKLSLDSYKAETIQHLLPLIDIVNDVSANLPQDCLEQIRAENKIYLFMHSLSVPADPKLTLNTELNPIEAIKHWLDKKTTQLFALGFKPQQLISDPGIGFNKTMNQSWYLLKHIQQLQHAEIETLVGHSRKRFLNKINSSPDATKRDEESARVACHLANQAVDYVRIHNYQAYHQQVMSQNQLQDNFNQ